ncbi:hypothetical protein ACN47E_001299 [Coniothyrium glycines]
MHFLHFLTGAFIFLTLTTLISAFPVAEDNIRANISSLSLDSATLVTGHSTVPVNVSFYDPGTASIAGYDPSFEWHDYSTVQIWIGRTPKSVGNTIGGHLYNKVYHMLDHDCPDVDVPWRRKPRTCTDVADDSFFTTCLTHPPFGVGLCSFVIREVKAVWMNEETRRLLIQAVAATLEALTSQPVGPDSNCFMVGGSKGCNVGDAIRINFPTGPPPARQRNYMYMRFENIARPYGRFECCKSNSRQLVDAAIDRLGPQIMNAYMNMWPSPRSWSRDTRCIINGWKAC